ncbi:MAG: hypothetical protein ABI678_07380 [Kofleriaceae bacterium]
MRLAVLALAILAGSAWAKPKPKPKHRAKSHAKSHAKSRFEHPVEPEATPAARYGAMSAEDCETELGNRHIGFTKETARGVLAPVRLTGTLHGVEFRTDANDTRRSDSPYEIADCRLVLAMDDFAAILAPHDIVQVRHYSMYRPPPKSWADDKLGGQHNGALALDAGRFTKKDGSVLDVVKDFHGKIGAPTCGDGAGPHPVTDNAKELRDILCTTVAAHLFNVVLTPNFNRPHRNHFHLEVMANVKWFLVH